MKRNKLKEDINSLKKHIADMFDYDHEIIAMREIYT